MYLGQRSLADVGIVQEHSQVLQLAIIGFVPQMNECIGTHRCTSAHYNRKSIQGVGTYFA
jgi:hypothetical protein